MTSIIHLGDHASDAQHLERLTGRRIITVRGNNDYNDLDVPNERILSVFGVRLYLTHGHLYGVNYGVTKLTQRAQSMGCIMALFGHSHIYACGIEDGIRYLNPGSISLPRCGDRASYAVLTISDSGESRVERVLV